MLKKSILTLALAAVLSVSVESPNGKAYPINSVNNIFEYSDQIIDSAKRFIE